MDTVDIKALNERIQQESSFVDMINMEMNKVIVGQKHLVEGLLIGMLSNGHILLEGVPGLAKTLAINTLATTIDAKFSRIQFTPDLLPADVIGTMIYSQKREEFVVKQGPIFANFILADEINRTSPKTQASLLEVMEEYQVTVDGITHALPQPFIVLATQNPGEFVGTYPLPEAQMDRFFLRISIGYPSVEQEMDVLERYSGQVKPMETLEPVCSAQDIILLQQMVTTIYCAPEVRAYVAQLVAATRQDPALQLGASTRAAIALIHGAQACALLDGRDFILPEDVQHMVLPVLSHRLLPNPEARMKGITAEQVLMNILQNVAVPLKL